MRVLTILVLSMLVFGCGKSNFTGRFTGNTTTGSLTRGAQGQPEQIVMEMTEQGGNVTGTWTNVVTTQGQTQVSGSLVGQVQGQNINLQLTMPGGQTGGTCQGTAVGQGTYNQWHLVVNFTMSGMCQGSTQVDFIHQPR